MGSRAQGRRLIRPTLSFVLLLAGTAGAFAQCDLERVDLRGDWGVAGFNVEVADDPKERERGLMFVTEMPFSAGMLFVYQEPRRAVFWMKNTLIPLDMIFMDPSGVVTHIHENAIPRDLTGIDGGDNVQFVLEINGGLSHQLGISVGSELRHPQIGETAAWGCD